MNESRLFSACMLEGEALDRRVAELNGGAAAAYSTDWNAAGAIIFRDEIAITPPHDKHVSGGPNAGWWRYTQWTAVVSSRTRTRPNPNGGAIAPTMVGRGMGPTPLIAAMRAFVDSHGG